MRNALWRAGTVTARSFLRRRSEADDCWISAGPPSEGIDLKREICHLGGASTPSWIIKSKGTADLATDRPKGLKNL